MTGLQTEQLENRDYITDEDKRHFLWPVREDCHPLPSSEDFKMDSSLPPPPFAFMACTVSLYLPQEVSSYLGDSSATGCLESVATNNPMFIGPCIILLVE